MLKNIASINMKKKSLEVFSGFFGALPTANQGKNVMVAL